jgi:hypothetical protein
MKTILALLCVFGIFLPAGFARDEDTAIREFRKETAAMKEWIEKEQFKTNHPAMKWFLFPALVVKMKAIPTDGLPKDLVEPWQAHVGFFERAAAIAEQLPREVKELEKKMAEPEFARQFQAQMETLSKEFGPEMAKLREAAKKYGIDGVL